MMCGSVIATRNATHMMRECVMGCDVGALYLFIFIFFFDMFSKMFYLLLRSVHHSRLLN